MSKKEDNRFQIILDEKNDFATGSRILKDTRTGVLYYFAYSGYAGGLTPLIDRDGRPLTDTAGYSGASFADER